MAQPTHQSFTVGGVLSRSFAIYTANFAAFLVMGLIVMSPMMLVWTLRPDTEALVESLRTTGRLPGSHYLALLLEIILPVALGFILAGALTFGVYQRMTGRSPSVGESISVGIGRLVSVLLVGLAVVVIVSLGFIALVIPGIILACMYWVAVPAAVVEKVGVGQALSRSKSLTSGYKGTIFGITFIIGIINSIVGLVAGVFLNMLGITQGHIAFAIALLVLSAIFSTWQATAVAVGYHDLRAAKEGVDVETLAAAFA